MKFFVACAKGLEYLLVDELVALGATRATAATAGVNVEGPVDVGYRAAMFSRLASRCSCTGAIRSGNDQDRTRVCPRLTGTCMSPEGSCGDAMFRTVLPRNGMRTANKTDLDPIRDRPAFARRLM